MKKDKWRAWFKFHQPSGSLVTVSDQFIVVEKRQVQSGNFWVLVPSQGQFISPHLDFFLSTLGRGVSSLQGYLLLVSSETAVKCFERFKESYRKHFTLLFLIISWSQVHWIALLLLLCFWNVIIAKVLFLIYSLFFLILVLHPCSVPTTTASKNYFNVFNVFRKDTHILTHAGVSYAWSCNLHMNSIVF